MSRRRVFKKFTWFLLIIAVLVVVVGGFIFAITLSGLPSLELLAQHQVSESTKIYDREGTTLLYEIYGEERRTVIPFEKMPQTVIQATIAIEDADFYNHSAIDLRGIFRAALSNIRSGGVVQGGSTITQQLAKKAFLSDERTFTRKLKEVIIAYKLEQTFTKNEILELYLNQIPYGNNAYGIESAAQTYFQATAESLSLSQTALLASLPQAPSYFDPFGSHLQDLLARKDAALNKMAEIGYITVEERDAAKEEKLEFVQIKNLQHAPHFALAVKEYLDNQYGEDFIRRSGLEVITTLDTRLQEIAEKAVSDGAARNTELYKGTNSALVAQDPKTGQILAMVGSRNFFDKEIDGQFNVATQGLRQPGSALKPFIYMAALEKGFPSETILFDLPTEFYPNRSRCPETPTFAGHGASEPNSPCFHPENFDGRFLGPVDLRAALAQSRNVPAVKVLYLVGLPEAVSWLQKFGLSTITDPFRYGLSLVLGGGEVRLVDLVGAYSVLAQEGVLHNQQFILSIKDQNGKTLEEYRDVAEPIVAPQYPRVINDILSDKKARALLFSSSLHLTVFPGYDVAIKTGTTNDYRDAWTVGYSPSLAAGVWAGNNDNTPMQRQGGSLLAAVPILSAFLSEALPLTPNDPFVAPEPQLASNNKPFLNGNYLATYKAGNTLYPQIHDILYYVDKNDPAGPAPINPGRDSQFANWEQNAIAWATSTIPGIQLGITHNQPLPPGATLVENQTNIGGSVLIINPKPGEFINDNSLFIEAQARSEKEITKIEVFFNGILVDTRTGGFGQSASYQSFFSVGTTLPQNTITVTATDISGATISKDVVIFR